MAVAVPGHAAWRATKTGARKSWQRTTPKREARSSEFPVPRLRMETRPFEGETSRYEADLPVPPDRLLRCGLEQPRVQGLSALVGRFEGCACAPSR